MEQKSSGAKQAAKELGNSGEIGLVNSRLLRCAMQLDECRLILLKKRNMLLCWERGFREIFVRGERALRSPSDLEGSYSPFACQRIMSHLQI